MIKKILNKIKNAVIEIYNFPRLVKETANALREERKRSIDPEAYYIYIIPPSVKDGSDVMDVYISIPEIFRSKIVWTLDIETYKRLRGYTDGAGEYLWRLKFSPPHKTILDRPYILMGPTEEMKGD